MIGEAVSAALQAFWSAGASAAAASIAQSLVKNAGGNDFHGSWKSYSAGVVQQQPIVQQQQPIVQQQQPVVQQQQPVRPVSYHQPYYQAKPAQVQNQISSVAPQPTLFEKIDYDEYRV